jgi:hypothetical protein
MRRGRFHEPNHPTPVDRKQWFDMCNFVCVGPYPYTLRPIFATYALTYLLRRVRRGFVTPDASERTPIACDHLPPMIARARTERGYRGGQQKSKVYPQGPGGMVGRSGPGRGNLPRNRRCGPRIDCGQSMGTGGGRARVIRADLLRLRQAHDHEQQAGWALSVLRLRPLPTRREAGLRAGQASSPRKPGNTRMTFRPSPDPQTRNAAGTSHGRSRAPERSPTEPRTRDPGLAASGSRRRSGTRPLQPSAC